MKGSQHQEWKQLSFTVNLRLVLKHNYTWSSYWLGLRMDGADAEDTYHVRWRQECIAHG